MPTYSYECKRCSHTQDVFHGMNEKPRIKCEACGGPCSKLLGTGAGIIFKGSGFYETDYKKKGRESHKESSTKSSSEPAAAAPAKTEASGSDKKASPAKKND